MTFRSKVLARTNSYDEKPVFLDILDLIRPFPVAEFGRNCQKAHLHAKTFHLLQRTYEHPLQRNSLKKLMFKKTLTISGNRIWPILQKGTSPNHDLKNVPTPTSIWPSITKKRPGKAQVSKNAVLGSFGQIWPMYGNLPNLAETVKRHIYTPQPFNCAHSHVYTPMCYTETEAHLHDMIFHLSLFPGLTLCLSVTKI